VYEYDEDFDDARRREKPIGRLERWALTVTIVAVAVPYVLLWVVLDAWDRMKRRR